MTSASTNDRRLVVLALVRIDGASGIKSKNLVAEVQTGHYKLQSLVEAVAALNIELCVCI